MTAIFLVFNFLLIVFAFYLIVYLYQRVKLIRNQNDELKEKIEQVLASSLDAFQKENDRLIEQVRTIIGDKSGKMSKDAKEAAHRGRTDQSFNHMLNQAVSHPSGWEKKTSPHAAEQAAQTNWAPPIVGIKDRLEESDTVKAMKLKQQGYTVTEIAKKLNKGKNEIELLLKFKGANRS
ncbi:MAG: hypothetical protein LKI80_07085 [Sporolactobacillus sp.]|jgi:polyhydroxyalkanoate synthesis regulator protein|nr:hypothetical protein [Sporolactobacillus sp.]